MVSTSPTCEAFRKAIPYSAEAAATRSLLAKNMWAWAARHVNIMVSYAMECRTS